MKTYKGVEVWCYAFLILATELNGQLRVSAVLPPWKESLILDRRLVRPQIRSGHGGDEKIPCLCLEILMLYLKAEITFD
jgi:hypothetical protein